VTAVGYTDVIKRPLDLKLLRRRLGHGECSLCFALCALCLLARNWR
jgi:hypothetical protein